LTRDSRIELLSLNAHRRSFGYPKSTEHPHKLPNLIVKELLKLSLEKDRLFYSTGCLCQEKLELFSSWRVPPVRSRARILQSA
jgi:hypothetical protein